MTAQRSAASPPGDGGTTSHERNHGATAGGAPTEKTCVQCGATKTPMWRNGLDGQKTLCNACGVRLQRQLNKLKAVRVAAAATRPGGAPSSLPAHSPAPLTPKRPGHTGAPKQHASPPQQPFARTCSLPSQLLQLQMQGARSTGSDAAWAGLPSERPGAPKGAAAKNKRARRSEDGAWGSAATPDGASDHASDGSGGDSPPQRHVSYPAGPPQFQRVPGSAPHAQPHAGLPSRQKALLAQFVHYPQQQQALLGSALFHALSAPPGPSGPAGGAPRVAPLARALAPRQQVLLEADDTGLDPLDPLFLASIHDPRDCAQAPRRAGPRPRADEGAAAEDASDQTVTNPSDHEEEAYILTSTPGTFPSTPRQDRTLALPQPLANGGGAPATPPSLGPPANPTTGVGACGAWQAAMPPQLLHSEQSAPVPSLQHPECAEGQRNFVDKWAPGGSPRAKGGAMLCAHTHTPEIYSQSWPAFYPSPAV